MDPIPREDRPALHLVGLETDASNAEAQRIGALWQRFREPEVAERLAARSSPVIYAVYADYAGDHTQPYRFFLGHAFPAGAAVPAGCVVREAPAGPYARFDAVGAQPAALIETWGGIWSSDLERSFDLDYEVHDPAAPERVVIYVR